MSRRFVSSVAISLALMTVPYLCLAQRENQPQMREKPSAKQLAEAQTKRMEKELQLTEKQYKKVYSLNLKEQNLRENLMTGGPGGQGGPGMGGPGGQGGPGMGGPGGQGGPGMGGPGGQGMGGHGGPGMGGSNMGGPGMGDIENSSEMLKFQEKKEKKMRKILTEQQYSIWEDQETRKFMEQPILMDAPDDMPAL